MIGKRRVHVIRVEVLRATGTPAPPVSLALAHDAARDDVARREIARRRRSAS